MAEYEVDRLAREMIAEAGNLESLGFVSVVILARAVLERGRRRQPGHQTERIGMKDYIQEMERLAQVQEAYKAMDSLLAQKQCPSKNQEQIARRKMKAYQARLHYLVDAYPFSVVINHLHSLERLVEASAWLVEVDTALRGYPHRIADNLWYEHSKIYRQAAADHRAAVQMTLTGSSV